MKNLRQEFPEIDEIRQDLDSLKTNVVELSRHVNDESRQQASRLGEIALERLNERLEKLRLSANAEYARAKNKVKAEPGKSIAIAFAAGIAFSFLLGRGK